LDSSCFFLSNVYGPSHADGKLAFVTSFHNFDSSLFDDWIVAGDFNMYRSSDDRNKHGGDIGDKNLFNNLISDLELLEIPFSGRTYTWSNMQLNPLLVKLDRVFCSANWNLSYPDTTVQTLSRPISDHTHFVLSFGSTIPKTGVFRFENYWADHSDFLNIVDLHWNSTAYFANAAQNLSAKFKQVRKGLKQWRKSFLNFNRVLHNCDWVLLLLDGLEEQRPLSVREGSLRSLVKLHIAHLLKAKRNYWKQRNTIRWVKLGDENTSFFQASASICHRRNHIASLTDTDGTIITNHDQKAGLLWTAFKNRMGLSDYSAISYDLPSLLVEEELGFLASDFSEEEFLLVIKSIPSDHARGPDGFNGKFIKKCWQIIKTDFLRLFIDFFANCTDLTSINSSYIALVPKKPNPETVDDFRPISLLNYSVKCIMKLLSTRLQSVILRLVHANQYGFIKGRTIQDCLAWAFQFLHFCHHSKKEIIILKLDFEKAFDKIEHQVILEVMKYKGFPTSWIKWTEAVLKSGNSSVLLNGLPSKPFSYRRGVRQGDPLSPLLFVLAADLLQTIVNKAWQIGLLKHPLSDDF